MSLNPQDLMLMVGLPALAVFVIDYFSNLLSFGNRIVNALVAAIVLGAVLVGLAVATGTGLDQIRLQDVGVAAGVMFVVGLLGNLIAFSNRFVNALVTALLFAVAYGALMYSVFHGVPTKLI